MKTILERRLKRESVTPIRRSLRFFRHLFTSDVNIQTPVDLAEEIVNNIDVDWANPALRFLDVKSNCGTFSLLLVEKLLAAGHPQDHILDNMIYAVDSSDIGFSLSNATFKRTFNRSGNIYKINLLDWDTNMKFDVVVGNPPFQETRQSGIRKDQASNLWSKFWVKSLQNSSDAAIVALITPTSWTSPSDDIKGPTINGKKRLWDIFDSYGTYANVTSVASYFPKVGSTFGYAIVDKSKNFGLRFTNNSPSILGFLPKSNIDTVMEQLSTTNCLGTHFKISQKNLPLLRVSIPMTRSLTVHSAEILSGGTKPTTGSDKEELYLYTYVPDIDTATQVVTRINECLDILNHYCKFSGFINIKIFKMIKFNKKG